ncbi:unnamed protein product [Cochlearia groenlandica]
MALSKGVGSIRVESDSQSLILALKEKKKISEVYGILEDIQALTLRLVLIVVVLAFAIVMLVSTFLLEATKGCK